jgi:diacylglycerol kinase (ATP)
VDNANQKVFVVFNPTAGNAEDSNAMRSTLAGHFTSPRWTSEIYETTGKEDLPAICRAACERSVSLVIAVGGDGTVVGVANGLVNGKVPLGIVPLGTGNVLARVLGVPLKVDEALDMLTGDHDVLEIDALKVEDRYFFSNVSVGLSPQMVEDTKSAQKERFGLLAYLWTVLKESRLFKLRRYTLTIDGQKQRINAAEVMISNTTLLEAPPHVWGPPETLADSQLEVYVVMAHTLGDYVRLVWDVLRHGGQSAAKFDHWTGQHSIRIDTDQGAQLVQGDGEVMGHTPVEIQMVPKALRVIRPKPKAAVATT